MSDPTITDYPGTIPGKSQSQAAFDTNVDAFLNWLTATNVPEYKMLAIWIRARVLEVAATAMSGDLPSIAGQAGNALVVNAAETAVAFAPISGRNLIINGSGRVNQRAYVSAVATTVANQFTLDRWFVVTSGQNLTFTGTDAGRTMTAPAGGVSQVIEGANIAGGTYVINWTGTATCTVGGVSRAKGDTFTLTANTNVTVRFTGGTYTDVQIELGTVATTFERVNIGDEIRFAQRYYETGSMLVQSPAVGVVSNSITFASQKRATPTMGSTTSNALNISSFNAAVITPSGFSIGATAIAVNGYVVVDWVATAELTA